MMDLFRPTCLDILAVLIGVILMDVLVLAFVRAGWLSNKPVFASLSLVAWIAMGIPILYSLMGRRASLPIQNGAFFFYGTGCLVYMEMRSVLSRGYSLRILIDLRNRGGQADVGTLKSSYGGGVGVSGLLLKRLQTLTEFRLLKMEGGRVGPLTPWGRMAAATGDRLRRLLRLEQVG